MIPPRFLMTGLAATAVMMAGCGPRGSVPHSVRVYFSPQGGATQAIISALEGATNSIRVQAYSFTSAPIARSLVDAHRRGVTVHIILDDSQRSEKYSEADFLEHSGIPPLIDARHGIAHNKIILVDGHLVITGSFNFTKAAEERNAENLLLIDDPELASRYLRNWEDHAEHAEPYHKPARAP